MRSMDRPRRPLPVRRLLLGALLPLGLLAAGSLGAQTKPPPGGELPPNNPPTVGITTAPEAAAVSGSQLTYRMPAGSAAMVDVQVRGCDQSAIDASSLQVTWKGSALPRPAVVSNPSPTCTHEVLYAPVRLDINGGGTLTVRLCDALGLCSLERQYHVVHEPGGDRAPTVTSVQWRDWRQVNQLNPTGTADIPFPYSLTVTGADFWFGAGYDDDNLQTATRTVTLNGATVQAGALRLTPGLNTIVARICDAGGQCAERVVRVTSDVAPPVITFSPAAEHRATAADQAISVSWADATSAVDTDTRRVMLNGIDITGTLTHEAGRSYGTVQLQAGENAVQAYICDRRSGMSSANCGEQTVKYYLTAAPRVAPTLSLAAHPGQVLRPPVFEATLSYTSVPHFTLDQPQAVTLQYHSAAAAPLGTVHLDVNEASGEPPATLSIALVDAAGARVRLTNGADEAFFRAGSGLNRLTAQFEAFGLATGAYTYTAVVRSWWADGSTLESRIPVRVLVRNDRGSPFGAGWTVAGYERIHVQGADALLADGDGSLLYFARTGCASEAWAGTTRQVCSFRSPDGEPSTLQLITQPGTAPFYHRTHPDYSQTVFAADGAIQQHRSLVADGRPHLGVVLSYEHDAAGRLWRVHPPFAGPMTLNYSAAGRLASIQDGYGRTTNTTVDARNHLTTVFDPDNVVGLAVAYDTLTAQATQWTGREAGTGAGAAHLFYYDRGELYAASTPIISRPPTGGVRGQMRYRSLPAMTVPAAGTGTTLAAPVARVHPDNLWLRVLPPVARDSTTFRVDRTGLATHTRNRGGQVTTTYRNQHGLDTLVTGPSGSYATRWNGWRMTERSILTDTTRYVYEPRFQKLARVVAPTGDDETRIWYNDLLLPDSVWVEETGKARFTYDQLGRVLRTWDDHGTDVTATYEGGRNNTLSVTQNGFILTHTRDSFGRIEQSTNSLGQTAVTRWNVLNQPVAVRGAAGDSVRMSYRAGMLASITDPNNQTHQFQRNAYGLETLRTDPRNLTTRYAYNQRAQVDSVITRRGHVVRTTYDAQGRPTEVAASDGSYLRYAYDDLSQTTVLTTPVSTDTVRADQRGLLVSETSVRQDGTRFAVERTRTAATIPLDLGADEVPTYRKPVLETATRISGRFGSVADRREYRDLEGRPFRRTLTVDAGESVLQFELDSLSRIKAAGHPLDLRGLTDPWLRIRYDQAGVSSLQYRNLETIGYQHDPAGRTTRRTIGADTSLFEYDAHNWLKSYRTFRAGDTISRGAYTFDQGGNRSDSLATVEAGNRLTSLNGQGMVYDNEGNLTRRVRNNGGHVSDFAWNAFGQLSYVDVWGWGRVSFHYDGLGRRIRKITPQRTIDYVYDGGELAAEVDGTTGAVIATYLYHPGVDRPYAMRRADGAEYRFVTDAQGSVVAVTRGDVVVNRYRYDPWGGTILAEEGVPNPFRFAGRELDAETGLYYVRARYYDPEVGRFISEDPSHLAGGMNLYAYAANNPLTFTDPSGLAPMRSVYEGPCAPGQKRETIRVSIHSDLSIAEIQKIESESCVWVVLTLDGIEVSGCAGGNRGEDGICRRAITVGDLCRRIKTWNVWGCGGGSGSLGAPLDREPTVFENGLDGPAEARLRGRARAIGLRREAVTSICRVHTAETARESFWLVVAPAVQQTWEDPAKGKNPVPRAQLKRSATQVLSFLAGLGIGHALNQHVICPMEGTLGDGVYRTDPLDRWGSQALDRVFGP